MLGFNSVIETPVQYNDVQLNRQGRGGGHLADHYAQTSALEEEDYEVKKLTPTHSLPYGSFNKCAMFQSDRYCSSDH